MKNSIPATKSKSKIKPLENKIITLEEENHELLEEMYEKGIRTRPSIMTQIEKEEAETLRHIKYCIEACEKVTGRKLRGQLCDLSAYMENI
jgi:hypothetical protein